MEFEAWTESIRAKLALHYGENYETSYNIEIGGITAPVLFSMRNRQPKSYLGFAMKNAPLSPEACELVFVLHERVFTAETFLRVRELIECAEREYITPGKDHGFTFISVVILCETAEKDAAKALKKYKLRKEYFKGGWMLSRAIIIMPDGVQFCSKDGSDFKRLLNTVLAK